MSCAAPTVNRQQVTSQPKTPFFLNRIAALALLRLHQKCGRASFRAAPGRGRRALRPHPLPGRFAARGTSAGDGQAARHLAKLIHASNESQAEILRLVLRAELRMVDEIRVARERREIARRKDGPAIRDLDRTSDKIAPATLAEIGVDRRRVHEWRILAEVGFEWIEQQICLALLAGRAPTYEEILRAATGTPCQASSPPRAPRPGGYPPCGRARG
jgi:hypothetical protein